MTAHQNSDIQQPDQIYLFSNNEAFLAELDSTNALNKYSITTFHNAREFESACDIQKPTLILFDIDSAETIQVTTCILKLQNGIPHRPYVIALGHSDQMAQRILAADCAATRYFPVSVSAEKLCRSIDYLLQPSIATSLKILIVDEEVKRLTDFSHLLNNAEIQTESLDDPFKLLDSLQSYRPDLVLLSNQFNNLSGIQLTKIIRQEDRFDHIPILLIGTQNDNNDEPLTHRQILDAGADGYIAPLINNNDQFVSNIKARARRARRSKAISDSYIEALRESRSRQQVLDEHTIITVTDTHGIIISANQKSCAISGYSNDEQVGQHWQMHNSDRHPQHYYEEMFGSLTEGKVWKDTFYEQRKNGSKYWLNSTIVPFLDRHGKPYQYVISSTDVTESKANAERLQRSQIYANIGTWDINLQTEEVYWSECVSKLMGYEQPEPGATYSKFFDAVYSSDRDRVKSAVDDCVEKGMPYDIEYRIVWPDDSIHWLHEKGNTQRDTNTGVALRMLGVVQDVTERKAIELELSRYKRAMDSSMHGMAILNLDETFRYVNPAWAELHGYTKVEEIQNQNWKLLVPAEYHAQFNDEIFPALASVGHWHGESKSIRIDGSQFDQRLYLDLLGARGIVCTIQDTSSEKQYEQALLSAVQDAEQANQAKTSFLSSMSHELRTPLNAIIGFSQLLQLENKPSSDNSTHEFSKEIFTAGQHLLGLVNEILNLEKIESGNIEVNFESIDLIQIIQECISLLTPLTEKTSITIDMNINGLRIDLEKNTKIHRHCLADPTLVRQAFINLLSNAIKYNRPEGNITIDIVQIAGSEKIRINVIDTGYGLTKLQQLKLFQPFQRLLPENKKSLIEGSGIGLVITKNLIGRMNGTIGFSSEPDKGSTFWFELPECSGPESNPVNIDSINNSSALPISNIPIETHTILYIEDNPANMRLVEGLFKHQKNIRLITATESIPGIEMARQANPDLILTDINLPEIDGYGIIEILSSDPLTQNIPIIAVSANAMQEDIDRAINAGFREYITKPIDLNGMLETIERIIKTE